MLIGKLRHKTNYREIREEFDVEVMQQ